MHPTPRGRLSSLKYGAVQPYSQPCSVVHKKFSGTNSSKQQKRQYTKTEQHKNCTRKGFVSPRAFRGIANRRERRHAPKNTGKVKQTIRSGTNEPARGMKQPEKVNCSKGNIQDTVHSGVRIPYLYKVGFLSAIVSAPCPPMEWPVIPTLYNNINSSINSINSINRVKNDKSNKGTGGEKISALVCFDYWT
jgi:hypothetical protein